MKRLPPVHVLESYLPTLAEIVERCPEAICLFDRLEALIEEARAAEIDDPVARVRARRAAQRATGFSTLAR